LRSFLQHACDPIYWPLAFRTRNAVKSLGELSHQFRVPTARRQKNKETIKKVKKNPGKSCLPGLFLCHRTQKGKSSRIGTDPITVPATNITTAPSYIAGNRHRQTRR